MSKSNEYRDKPLVVGIGNEFREDDAFGVKVVELLQSTFPDNAEYISKNDLGSLIEVFPNRDLVVIDAIKTDLEKVGILYEAHSVDGLITHEEIIYSTHGLGIAETLKLAKILKKNPKSFYFIGVEGNRWEMGKNMSLEVKDKIPFVMEKVKIRIKELTN